MVQQLPGTPGVTLGLTPRIVPEEGWLVAAGRPLLVCVPVAVVPTPALPEIEPNEVELPLHGRPEPASPELGNSGEETAGEMIVLWPTGGPDGTVGVVGVVSVPCAQTAGAAESRTRVVKASRHGFISFLRVN